LEESKIHDNVYLVYEGECILRIRQNKYLQEALFKPISKTAQGKILTRGLLSKTAITAQIGLLSPGSWFGEEGVMLNSPVSYSVTARNYCTILVMKSSSFSNLPSELLAAIAERTKVKTIWKLKRLEQLTKTTTNLLNEDMGNRIYQKSVKKLEQEFPQASASAIQNLSKLILKNEPKLTPSIFHKLGYVRGRMCNSTLRTCTFIMTIKR